MGVDNFGIFAEDRNPFTVNEVVWNSIITQLVFYPFLILSLPFFLVIYPIIDLYYLLSFNFSALGDKVSAQLETIGSLLVNIASVPLDILLTLLMSF